MSVVLIILLIAFCLQALAKFAVWFLVPYETRIRRIASYYDPMAGSSASTTASR